MKKRILKILLIITTITLTTACGSDSTSNNESEIETTETQQTLSEITYKVEQLNKYFDTTPYNIDEYGDGSIFENTTSKDLSFIEVNGTKFKLGISYDEVLKLGYKPVNTEFENESPSGLAITEKFINNDGKEVELGFATNYDDSIKESSVKDAGFLYSIHPEDTFSVAGINKESLLSEIIAELGNPKSIWLNQHWDNYPSLIYLDFCNRDSNNKELGIYVDLDSEKIISLTLEGYDGFDE